MHFRPFRLTYVNIVRQNLPLSASASSPVRKTTNNALKSGAMRWSKLCNEAVKDGL